MKNKVITMCGSKKFQEKVMDVAFSLELKGNCILTPVFKINTEGEILSEEEINILSKMHFRKIELSDAIYVVNVGGYIGKSVKNEIEYAKQLGKEILYLEEINGDVHV